MIRVSNIFTIWFSLRGFTEWEIKRIEVWTTRWECFNNSSIYSAPNCRNRSTVKCTGDSFFYSRCRDLHQNVQHFIRNAKVFWILPHLNILCTSAVKLCYVKRKNHRSSALAYQCFYNLQQKSYWFAHLTYILLLYYLGKINL